jgi:hypothetical protein
MARKSNFIGTTQTGNLSALGNAQQRDFDFIRNLLKREDLTNYFAEPSVQENQEKIDWYSSAEGKVVAFSDFDEAQIETARNELNALMRELSQLARLAENEFDQQAIKNLSVLPDRDSIKLVGDQITIINWAYKLHKREKNERQSANFAGFVRPNEEDLDNQASSIIHEKPLDVGTADEEQKDYDDLIEDVYDKNDEAEGVFDQVGSSTTENLENLTETFQDDISDSSSKNDRREESSQSIWVWILVFFLMLVLNLLLLKDACGVQGLPFLYFC